jgi:hypothetical protein
LSHSASPEKGFPYFGCFSVLFFLRQVLTM